MAIVNPKNTDPDVPEKTSHEKMPHEKTPHANRDPLTNTPGAHPVGTSIGAASAGLAGAYIGSLAGPGGTIVGGAIGAAIGAVAGGLAGKGVAEVFNPTDEDAYWRENFRFRPYYTNDQLTYEDYLPAYQYGWEATRRYPGRSFDDVENELRADWENLHPDSSWATAAPAIRDSYERITKQRAGSLAADTSEPMDMDYRNPL